MRQKTAASVLCGAVVLAGSASAQMDELLVLEPADSVPDGRFGQAVSLVESLALVGQPGDPVNGPNSGAAYLLDALSGTELFKLVASDGTGGDLFGDGVALGGGLAAVAASAGDGDGVSASGSVYIFDAATGSELSIIRPADSEVFGYFGSAISLRNGLLAALKPGDSEVAFLGGAAYVFDLTDPLNPVQLCKFIPSDVHEGGFFGATGGIALGNGVVLIGDAGNSDLGQDAGAAYLVDATTGQEVAKFYGSDSVAGDLFGSAVAVQGDRAVVTARTADGLSHASGVAYIFDISDPAAPVELMKLQASDGGFQDVLGRSVAISGDVIAMGAGQADGFAQDTGAVYLFSLTTGDQLTKLAAGDGRAGDRLGFGVALDAGLVLAGTLDRDGLGGQDSGGAYVFEIVACAADLNADGRANTVDVLIMLGAWARGDPLADWNQDGTIDTRDMLDFLADWATGCG